jgi:hypothetical protein
MMTGDDLISLPVLNVHAGLPSAACTAWNTPDRSPTNTLPAATAGDDSPTATFTRYLQRTAPVSSASATSSPDPTPT